MNRKRFNKDFDEVGRKSRVKMHKSGKNWVRTVMSQLSLLRVIRGKGQSTISMPQIDRADRLESQRFQYLKAALASGAVVTGTAVTTTAFAEEQVVVEQEVEETTDTVIDKNVVIVETATTQVGPAAGSETSVTDAASLSDTTQTSLSASESLSTSASISASTSASVSQSASESASASASASASVSQSASWSESLSTSVAEQAPASDTAVQASEQLTVASIPSPVTEAASATTVAEASTASTVVDAAPVSTASEVSLVAASTTNQVDQVVPENLTPGLSQLNSLAVATATATSETATGLVATSLTSDSSSQSETVSQAKTAERIATIDYIISYALEDGTILSGTAHQIYQVTSDSVATATVQVTAQVPAGYQLAAGQSEIFTQLVTENALNLITVKVVKLEVADTSAIQDAKTVLEQVTSEAEVLASEALRQAAKSTEDTSSLEAAANAAKTVAASANLVLADEATSLEEVHAQIAAIRTSVENLASQLYSFSGSDTLTVMLTATTTTEEPADEADKTVVTAISDVYTAKTQKVTSFTSIPDNAIVVIQSEADPAVYTYKRFAGPVNFSTIKTAYDANQFVTAATFGKNQVKENETIYVVKEADVKNNTITSGEESYDLTKFKHREHMVFSPKDSAIGALARPGAFSSAIFLGTGASKGISRFLPEDNNALLVYEPVVDSVEKVYETFEVIGAYEDEETGVETVGVLDVQEIKGKTIDRSNLFLSHVEGGDATVNRPNSVLELPAGVEVVYQKSDGTVAETVEERNGIK
ncbi:accessory Sec-dependent serine-rich glycoprotein adhesin [Streptococcus suis]|nr:accessory Sec-dependent serine-rich glycoprotein adhesin [Streptococcus suis]